MELEERRKSSTPRVSVAEILEGMQLTADQKHDGDLQNHILDIFLELPRGHQMTFLRRSLILQWESQLLIAKASFCDVYMEEEKMLIRRDDINKEREALVNQSRPTKMSTSSRVIMWIFILSVIGICLFSFILIYTEGKLGFNGTLGEEISHLYEVMREVFK